MSSIQEKLWCSHCGRTKQPTISGNFLSCSDCGKVLADSSSTGSGSAQASTGSGSAQASIDGELDVMKLTLDAKAKGEINFS